MAPRPDVIAAALKAYRPGALGDEYQWMDNKTSQEITDKTDEFLSRETGFYVDIDDRKPGHRRLMRQWLLIRDALIARRLYDERVHEMKEGEAVRLEAEISALHSDPPQTGREDVVPSAVPHGLAGKLLSARRIIAECSHVSDLMGVAAPVVFPGPGAVGLKAGAIGLRELIFLTAAMDEIGEAREIGASQAERHAFLHGFASYLVHGCIINSIGAGNKLGQMQLQGERAAKKMISRLPAHVCDDFLRTYRAELQRYPSENMDRALHDLGFRW